MNLFEILPLAFTAVGVAFGFGKQAGAIANLRRDVDSIAKMHRDTLELLSDVDRKLVRLDERINALRECR